LRKAKFLSVDCLSMQKNKTIAKTKKENKTEPELGLRPATGHACGSLTDR